MVAWALWDTDFFGVKKCDDASDAKFNHQAFENMDSYFSCKN